MTKVRVRFAPSPTGALHIGGVRTALYNYLFAKKMGGKFILRIEDTDQTRYVEGAEKYIHEALDWSGLKLDEGPGIGGRCKPYRQSERKEMYGEYAKKLVKSGHLYYAFDTPRKLGAARVANPNFRYDWSSRSIMNNSLNMSADELAAELEAGTPYVLRLKVPEDQSVTFKDIVRDDVTFQTNELDDKVMLKGDGMPTYHFANVVDDHTMKISHVIRGEEWLSSTAHHVLLYRAFGWEKTMPQFAHLPLILKPKGKGKLSKRDGAKFGIPVFPLGWEGKREEDTFKGFREVGFIPQAMINFLAFLGWNPGTKQEIFTLKGLCESFDLARVSKGGAKFDWDKARWFNQQYIANMDNAALAEMIRPMIEKNVPKVDKAYLIAFVGLMKERAVLLNDFWTDGSFFFQEIKDYDLKNVRKRWKADNAEKMQGLISKLSSVAKFNAASIEAAVEEFMKETKLGMGQVMPALRLALTGTMKGPSVYEMIELFGKEKTVERLTGGFKYFQEVKRGV